MTTRSLAEPRHPDTRETRALYRTRGREIVLVDADTYEVPSQDGARTYEVLYSGNAESCTCPDNTYRGAACVHLLAVAVKRAKRRGATARRLAALDERARHDDLPAEERLEVIDEAAPLRRRLGL